MCFKFCFSFVSAIQQAQTYLFIYVYKYVLFCCLETLAFRFSFFFCIVQQQFPCRCLELHFLSCPLPTCYTFFASVYIQIEIDLAMSQAVQQQQSFSSTSPENLQQAFSSSSSSSSSSFCLSQRSFQTLGILSFSSISRYKVKCNSSLLLSLLCFC